MTEFVAGAEVIPNVPGLPRFVGGQPPPPAPPAAHAAPVEGVAVIPLPGAVGPPAGRTAYPAAQPLSGHRLVVLDGGHVRRPDLSVPADAYALIGLTTGAAEAGALVAVESSGLITEPSWTWVSGELVYAGAAGALAQVPPPTGWLRIVGVAQTPTSLLVALREPIMRQE